MYDCSNDLKKFYRKHVVLSGREQNELRNKRKLNIKRLKDGLIKYNDENGTSYKVSEDRIQGSMAMHTTTQNDRRNYDIDVAVVFESDELRDQSSHKVKDIVRYSLKGNMYQFSEEPELKTSCVRVMYKSIGYHVDFAIFKRSKLNPWDEEYTYEHAGNQWSKRHIKKLEEWFNNEIQSKGDDFRKIVRLSKMYCKSRESWKNMPSGLIQTILCSEKFDQNADRLDEVFYFTMEGIVKRLEQYLEVNAPMDDERKLVTREVDYQRMKNFKNRLKTSLEELDVLFRNECTYIDAITAWGNFFNNSYWDDICENEKKRNVVRQNVSSYNDTEEFIEDFYPIYEQYDVQIDCRVAGNGFTVMPILKYLQFVNRNFIPHNFSIECSIKSTNCPSYDKILWKVLNVGDESKRRNDIRGQIIERGNSIKENSRFIGDHYIECYLIKNNYCVGIGHVDVPIGG